MFACEDCTFVDQFITPASRKKLRRLSTAAPGALIPRRLQERLKHPRRVYLQDQQSPVGSVRRAPARHHHPRRRLAATACPSPVKQRAQKHALPQCKTNGRFASISRHNVGEITCAAGRPWPSRRRRLRRRKGCQRSPTCARWSPDGQHRLRAIFACVSPLASRWNASYKI